MRIVIIVACAAALGFSAWANLPPSGQSTGAPTASVTTTE